jgi:O-6-methylguanine DNA methyltransferase
MTETRAPTALLDALAGLAEAAPATLLRDVGTALGVGDQYVVVDGPTGPVWVAFSERGINLLTTAADEQDFLEQYLSRWGPRPLRPAGVPPPRLAAALRPPTAGEATRLTYDLGALSPFQQAVLRKTAEIPPGEVRPYAWVAREMGQPGAVRAVGSALGRNPVPILIPCHRVVRSDGRIGNYALGTAMKSRLLSEEGVDVAELARLAAKGIRYVGNEPSRCYCLPTCEIARRTPADRRRLLRTAAQAVSAGFTPCRRCRPVAEDG